LEQTVERLFKSDILQDLMGRFDAAGEYKKLGDFENYVFEVTYRGKPAILRVTHSSHRKKEEIDSELEWMDFLHKNGVTCPGCYRSKQKLWVETAAAEDGSNFYACLYSKAPGSLVKVGAPEFNDKLFFAWGEVIGKMHAVTKGYKPSGHTRPSWDEEELLDIEQYVLENDIVKNTNNLIKELESLPANRSNYGLIHSDVHSGNFFFDGETVHVFDFDDCSYHWFASDIAIPLYYSLLYGFSGNDEAEVKKFSVNFYRKFLTGYQKHNELPTDLFKQLPLFLRLRDITLYSVLEKKIPLEERNENTVNMMDKIRNRILSNRAIIDFSEDEIMKVNS
jgi:Ser/Thr protein kinase RdoA (MazF antagonist)